MAYGYNGKILRIDLSSGVITIEEKEESFYRNLLGGRNIAAYMMLKEIPKDANPLGPENKLIIATSVLTGTPIPGSSRFTVAAKSPLTGGFGESEAGGWWGPELKFAGYDAIIVEGRAPKPVYIWIKNEKVEIRDAEHLWGKETGIVDEEIRKELGDSRIRVLQTGPAGENLVKYAAITNELRHWCGRTGLGAVMGSKNLRAIAVRGTQNVLMKDKHKVLEFCRWFSQNVKNHPGLSDNRELGTAKNVIPLNEMGLLPTYNFRRGSFEYAKEISGEKIRDTILVDRDACYACPVRCKRVVGYKGSDMVIEERYGGPEYESIGSLGSNCGIKDAKTVCKANELCARYGLDTISTGVTIAFAMECFEKGIITQEDTDRIELKYGNGEALLKMIEKIAKREGFGNILAEGSYRAGKIIGKGAEKYSMSVKRQEFPAHEPRGKWGVALQYAISPTGADHLVAAHDTWFMNEGHPEIRLSYIDISDVNVFGIREPVSNVTLNSKKVRLFAHLQYMWSLYNVLDLCIFIGVPEYRMAKFEQIVDLINHVTGWNISFWEAVKMGEKGITMARLFNIKHGISSEEDTLPERLFEPLENGAYKGVAIDREEFNKALKTYYQIMGWDEKGVPTYGKLVELGLEELYGEKA
ncbi:MAG: aldehyde:ferredoxin oxidoreductase [Thermoanaerobacteraceae bacterium]|jgi:aldehyde:ferredoxin oxidoreductase|nr:aldehyde:ferredoxin oxidoreductase [Thermoanaerobacteraceae bacterium]